MKKWNDIAPWHKLLQDRRLIAMISLLLYYVLIAYLMRFMGEYRFLIIIIFLSFFTYILTYWENLFFSTILLLIGIIYTEYDNTFLGIQLPATGYIGIVFLFVLAFLNRTMYKNRLLREEMAKVLSHLRIQGEVGSEGVAVIDRKGKVIECNEALARIFKTKKEELVSTQIIRLLVPEYRVPAEEIFTQEQAHVFEVLGQDSTQQNIPLTVSFEKEGEMAIISVRETRRAGMINRNISKIFNFYNAVKQISGMAILERDLFGLYVEMDAIRAKGVEDIEEYLRSNDDELSKFYKHIQLVDVNEEAIRLYQADNKQQLLDHFNSGAGVDREDLINSLVVIYQGKPRFERSITVGTLKGETRHILVKSNYPSRINTRHFTMHIDITEQTMQEQLLRETQIKYQQITDKAPLGISLSIMDRFILVNKKFVDIFGYDNEEEILELSIPDTQDPEYHDMHSQRYHSRLLNKQVYDSYRSFGRKKDGTRFPIIITVSHFYLGNDYMTLAFIQDITDEMRYEREKEKITLAMTEAKRLESLALLAGGIVHDFNNLLTAVNGGIELLSIDPELNQNQQEIVQIIKNASDQASNLTNQLLIYTGKAKLVPEPVNLSELLEQMKGLIKLSISSSIALEYQLEQDIRQVVVSESQIQQVILNSVMNASDAIAERENGKIIIQTTMKTIDSKTMQNRELFHRHNEPIHGSYVILTIVDNGEGIEQENIKKIFDPFYSTKSTGKGLGLSVVQGIIEQYKGTIEVDSTFGKGTSISYYFPVIQEASHVPTSENKVEYSKMFSGNALICDDEAVVRDILTKYLERMGLDIIVTKTGFEAIEIFQKRYHEIDIIFIDLTMPNIDGYQTFLKMTEIKKDTPIIISSGYSEIDLEQFSGYENFAFINKPYSINKLNQALSRFF